jgi:drug/metabolite transporter (DMT)-like permease
LELKTTTDDRETDAFGTTARAVSDLPDDARAHTKAVRWQIILALVSIYIIWGSTYLAVRIGLTGIPPFLLGGIRFVTAGLILLAILRARGEPLPARREVLGGCAVGALLLGIGNGGVVYAEQTVASGITALGVATVPLWVALFGGIWGLWPSRREWLGLLLGFAGMIVLNLDGGLRGSPAGAIAIIISSIGWSFGSVWSKRISMPRGFMSSAVQMAGGGIVMLLEGLVHHEHLAHFPGMTATLAEIYLIAAGISGYSAYVFLLNHTRPSLATSYAYVNPVVAMFLGAALVAEPITHGATIAMLLIIGGVILVATSTKRST